MKEKERQLRRLLNEVRLCAAGLPDGKRLAVNNYCDKISSIYRKQARKAPLWEDGETASQVIKRDCARKAILSAMMAGRHISLKDSAEFQVSQMHTQMHCISKIVEKMEGWQLCSEWIQCGTAGARCKEYWMERVENTLFSVLEQHLDGAWWYHPSYSFTSEKAARIAAQRFADDVFEPRPAMIVTHVSEFPKKSFMTFEPISGDFRAVDGEKCHVDLYTFETIKPAEE